MKEDNIDALFKHLKEDIDFATPSEGHQERFLDKLNQHNGVVALKPKRNLWKPLSIAASVALLCVLGFQFLAQPQSIKEQVVDIAPEISETEFYFASLIEEQVQILEQENSPETAKLVADTLAKLAELEEDYKNLEQELINGGNNKIILNAMITNFQIRIDLLEEVLANVETIKNLKLQDDANFTI